jgi:hypothetical protein
MDFVKLSQRYTKAKRFFDTHWDHMLVNTQGGSRCHLFF